MNNRGEVPPGIFYQAVGNTSLTWNAVKIAKSYFVDGDRVTTLVRRSGLPVARLQSILNRVNIELDYQALAVSQAHNVDSSHSFPKFLSQC